ncbi:response regulator [Xanthobacter sp. V4C-4]|uniref:response regulator n=1 Tax=Xanthobacter cornucopiae TaxID=3119924 RepID=UPI00372C4787
MKPLLLLVEDDPVEARRVESAARLMGYDCHLAGDGDAALALLERMAFDVVLLDLVLPGLDGMGLLGLMKARGIRVPVVAAVTAGSIDAAASAIRAGARDFVVKPAGALRLQVALANAAALGSAARPARADTGGEAVAPRRLEPAMKADPVPAAGGARAPWVDHGGHVRPLEEIEETAIRFACAHYGGRIAEVARRLGIGRSTLYRKLSRLGLMVPEGAAAPHHLEPMAARFVAAE